MSGEAVGRTALAVVLVLAVSFAGCQALTPNVSADDATESGDRSTSMTVTIDGVEDGDTFWYENESGETVYIRLLGVDTPEIRGHNYPEEYSGVPEGPAGERWLYRWGIAITNQTRERLVGKTVRLEFDPSLPKRDYYGRLLVYVYVDGTLLNRDLIRRGYARVYPLSFEKRAEFRETERAARAADRGVWNFTNGTAP